MTLGIRQFELGGRCNGKDAQRAQLAPQNGLQQFQAWRQISYAVAAAFSFAAIYKAKYSRTRGNAILPYFITL